ncbi:hypothetical protein [Paenarthrobacter sp. PH39-S1]|uniref:hypothetical protein n=1 Tax=Micrococcaceae TaxID=1268 RepID=UPI0024B96AB5|nr:hypothetical protein [Paenarthrobacter sp. PH39-S1]MDJ0355371.1 hypothetical protein [Paenarthrobacter sp. PH39-S1]
MINWGAFLTVAVTTLVSAVFVVGVYASGVRLYAVSVDDHVPSTKVARAAAYLCFAVSLAAVLFGIYLIVPALH